MLVHARLVPSGSGALEARERFLISTWRARFALALGAVVAALALLEVALRVLVAPPAPQVLRGLHRATPEQPWLYELVRGARAVDSSGIEYAIGEHGFRGPARPRAKLPGTFRIALLGDSVTFGYGVALDATFGRQLEGKLATLPDGPRWELLNLGVSGYNPWTEAALLRGVGLAFAPDLVLVQFCINDLNDPTLHFDASTMLALGAIPDGAFPDPDSRHAVRPPAVSVPLSWCRRSRLCTALTEAFASPWDQAEMVAALAPHEAPSPRELAWLEHLYAQMAADVRARGGDLAVVVFPYATQLEAGAPDQLQARLRALGEHASILVIDLLPAFRRAAGEPGGPLFLDLWHPTARGHGVAAEAILHALACARMLPTGSAGCPG